MSGFKKLPTTTTRNIGGGNIIKSLFDSVSRMKRTFGTIFTAAFQIRDYFPPPLLENKLARRARWHGRGVDGLYRIITYKTRHPLGDEGNPNNI